MSKFCPHCGHENKDVATFCGNCGNKLMVSNFSSNLRDGSSTGHSGPSTFSGGASGGSGSSTFSSGSQPSSKPGNSNESNAGTLCCGVILILFIIMLIMSMG